MNQLRVALICDYAEEGWHSMELLGEILPSALESTTEGRRPIRVLRVQPRLNRRFSLLPVLGERLDRIAGRFWDYPRFLRPQTRDFEIFHITDHSYSQLLHVLPAEKVIVTCHDLDTFRCVLEPGRDPRPLWFRLMTQRILGGFRKARHVICVSNTIRDEILKFGLHPASRLSVVPNGVHPSCSAAADAAADAEARRLMGPAGAPDALRVLHVGSTIPRKNLPALLQVMAAVHRTMDDVWLIRAGGPLRDEQQRLAHSLGISDRIITLPTLDRAVLAAVYRAAPIAVLPSIAEGFGLPLVEAMACGCVVLANDIPVLREVGGSAAVFASASQPEQFATALCGLLSQLRSSAESWQVRVQASLRQAATYSWQANAEVTARLYHQLSA